MKALILAAIAVAGAASAQTTPDAPAAAQPAVAQPAPMVRGVALNTTVDIAIEAALDSKTSKIDQTFPIRLVNPILDASGVVLVPAGTTGMGQIVHAARARAMGKAGEMILAARYLQCGDTRIPLGHFKFVTTGDDKSQLVMIGTVAISPVFMFISGGEVTVPVGARAKARTTADVAMTAEASASCLGPAKYEGEAR